MQRSVKSHFMQELEGAAVMGGTALLSYLLAPATGGASIVAGEEAEAIELASFARAMEVSEDMALSGLILNVIKLTRCRLDQEFMMH